ncbi:hypothetical protein COW64_19870 [bacterium (Candidatus Blackallbacteria) CG18_big_fil_WC_8_21_14_2_50_49_26]|nr:MAG: hypothetical protein COW64_19870 [bacterium (Candidatus Blackallbacteria) CG18_big_fil_WC_8_21_14_2_50_49_26]
MPTGFHVYSSKQILISIAGIPITGGFADGDFLRVERDTPAFGDVVGTDGEVTRNESRDDRANATLILMQSADANKVLSAMHRSDKNTPGGAGVGRFLVKDLNSDGTIHQSPFCWIMDDPKVTYGREAKALEWSIRIATLKNEFGKYA